jgi:hypothetical protein
MYKDGEVLDQNIFIKNKEGKLVPTTVVISAVVGGKRVNWVDADGNIIKSVSLSRSKYNPNKK